jgi:hypothetical protein
MKLLGTSNIATVSAIFAICGSSGCAYTPTVSESTSITAVAEVVPTPVGCGVIFVGTPITFRVVSGPRLLKGQLIEAVVPCLDFYPEFYAVGDTYQLQLTQKNLYKIEVWPDQLTAPNEFFLKSATNLETGMKNTWADAATRRGY